MCFGVSDNLGSITRCGGSWVNSVRGIGWGGVEGGLWGIIMCFVGCGRGMGFGERMLMEGGLFWL